MTGAQTIAVFFCMGSATTSMLLGMWALRRIADALETIAKRPHR